MWERKCLVSSSFIGISDMEPFMSFLREVIPQLLHSSVIERYSIFFMRWKEDSSSQLPPHKVVLYHHHSLDKTNIFRICIHSPIIGKEFMTIQSFPYLFKSNCVEKTPALCCPMLAKNGQHWWSSAFLDHVLVQKKSQFSVKLPSSTSWMALGPFSTFAWIEPHAHKMTL